MCKKRVALTKFRMLLGNVNASKADKPGSFIYTATSWAIGSGNLMLF